MVNLLFEDFLDNPEQYHACEVYWEQLVEDIARSMGQEGEWQRWLQRHYGNGTLMEPEYLPIYDGRSMELDRAFRIDQQRAIGTDLEILAYLKTEHEHLSTWPRDQLVIVLSLSQESAEIAKSLLRKWMTTTTTAEEMQSLINRVAPPR